MENYPNFNEIRRFKDFADEYPVLTAKTYQGALNIIKRREQNGLSEYNAVFQKGSRWFVVTSRWVRWMVDGNEQKGAA